MNDELTSLIIRELRKQRNQQTIIQKVCKHRGLNWKDAERLVRLIEAQHRRITTPRQSPALLFLSIGILLLGIGLLAFNMQILLTFFQRDIVDQIRSLQSSSYQLTGFVIGLVMTLGGAAGLWKAYGVMFPD